MQQVERGYVYQDRRRRDYDVRPHVTRQQRKKAEMTARDRSRILLALFVAGMLALGIIIAAAYGASVNYNNNKLRDSNAALKGEVEMLEIQIQSANNIAEIQERAEAELDMLYPSADQLVVLSQTAVAVDIGQALRATASADR
ncbi:MAG: cell division protein FtsL [Firmicutes bacterium]|nr:cell division protein FtsL [Bacillota bacterium]MBQ3964951.1 cell division protein FtsL [Bacillota bacterium]